jgi:hypothetical protein
MWLLSIAQMLTVVATGTPPGMATGDGSATIPDPIPTRQTYFAIPFEIDQMDHPVLGAAEIQLYVSRDRGATWQHETSVAPTTKLFLFRAPSDGEYWFAVRTRDRAGNFRPPLIGTPGLRVIIDTQAPSLTIDAQRGQAGQIIAKWRIDEANIKPDTFKLQYRVAGSQQWETIAVDPSKFQTDGTINSGEAIWWAPAGQGRIEIRVEVADIAGNPNVSHAQVTTVASAMPSDDVTARTPPNHAPSVAPQRDWQASSEQNAWARQNDYSTGRAPSSQEPSGYGPHGQGSGSGATSMAKETPANSSYSPNATPVYSGGSNPYGYDANQASSAGQQYDADPYRMARNSQSSSPVPSREVSQVGQYSQNRQPQSPQAFDQYDSQSGYGASRTPDESNSWARSSGYGTHDRPAAGTVAAQPSPPYQSRYNPYGDASTTTERQATGGHGSTPGYGSSAGKSNTDGATGRTVNTKLFEIDYTNPPQPMAVGRVELWGTRDGGVTWQSFGYDSDSRSPMLARVSDEGTYGFKVVFHPMHGSQVQAPRRGETPDMVIRVDLTRPEARLIGVDQSPSTPNQLSIRWQAADAQLADSPISLYYADATTGDWRLIAQGLPNSGEYCWNLPIGLPTEVQIRVEAHDMAGNVTTAETRNPIRLAANPRTQSGTPAYSVEIQDARPVGQTDRTAPRRYYIR